MQIILPSRVVAACGHTLLLEGRDGRVSALLRALALGLDERQLVRVELVVNVHDGDGVLACPPIHSNDREFQRTRAVTWLSRTPSIVTRLDTRLSLSCQKPTRILNRSCRLALVFAERVRLHSQFAQHGRAHATARLAYTRVVWDARPTSRLSKKASITPPNKKGDAGQPTKHLAVDEFAHVVDGLDVGDLAVEVRANPLLLHAVAHLHRGRGRAHARHQRPAEL